MYHAWWTQSDMWMRFAADVTLQACSIHKTSQPEIVGGGGGGDLIPNGDVLLDRIANSAFYPFFFTFNGINMGSISFVGTSVA